MNNTRSSRRAGIFNLHGAWTAGFGPDGKMHLDHLLQPVASLGESHPVTWFVNDLLDYFQSRDTLSPSTKEPIVNRNELQELAELRERVAALEEKEAGLYLQLATVLEKAHLSGMTYSRAELVNIARHAGAIRDALQPFDDGVRAPLPVPPVVDAAQVAKAYGVPTGYAPRPLGNPAPPDRSSYSGATSPDVEG